MNSKYRALIWEVWRRSRSEYAFKFGLMLMVTIWLSFQITSVQGAEKDAVAGVTIFMLICISLFNSIWIQELSVVNCSYTYRHWFYRPVPTWAIAVIPLAVQTCLTIVCYGMLAVLLNQLCFQDVPIVEPILWITVGNLGLTAAASGPSTQVGKLVSVVLVVIGIIAAFALHTFFAGSEEHFLMAVGRRSFFNYSLVHNVVLAILGIGFVFLLIGAVGVQRTGEMLAVEKWGKARRVIGTTGPVPVTFRNKLSAHFWLQYRKCSPVMIRFAIVLAVVSLGFCLLLNWLTPQTGAAQWLVFGLVGWPVVCQIVGSERLLMIKGTRGNFEYDAFESKMAMPSDQLVWIKIFVLGLVSLVSWVLMWFVVAIGLFAIEGGTLQDKFSMDLTVLSGISSFTWGLGLVGWVLFYFASAACLLSGQLWLSRNGMPFLIATGIGYGLGILAFVDGSRGWQYASAWNALGYGIAGLIGLMALRSIVLPVLKGATDIKSLVSLSLAWAMIIIPFWVGMYQIPELWEKMPWVVKSILAAISMVPLAGPVIAPLAMREFRHA